MLPLSVLSPFPFLEPPTGPLPSAPRDPAHWLTKTKLRQATTQINGSTRVLKFLKRWEYQTTLPSSWETCMQVKKQQLELYMEQTGSKLGKEYVKAIYCQPAYLTYMHSTSCKMPDCMKHKLESRLPGEISITSDIRWHHPYSRKWRGAKKPLDESERGEWKSWLKAQLSEN